MLATQKLESIFKPQFGKEGIVKIKSCQCLFQSNRSNLMLGNSKVTAFPLKLRGNFWNLPYGDNPEKFKEEYPNSNLVVYENGSYKFNDDAVSAFSVVLKSTTNVFDLSLDVERLKCEIAIRSDLVGKNPTPQHYMQRMYIEDVEATAKLAVDKVNQLTEALQIMKDATVDDIYNYLLLYGTYTKDLSHTAARAKLSEKIMTDPQLLIDAKANVSKTPYQIKLYKFMEEGVIVKNAHSNFVYKDIVIGNNETEAISYLSNKKNNSILEQMEKDFIKIQTVKNL